MDQKEIKSGGRLPVWRLVRKHIEITGFSFKKIAFVIVGLKLASTLFEGMGFAMLLPITEFMIAGQDLAALQAKSDLWRRLVESADSIGIPVNLFTLLSMSFVFILFRQLFQSFQVSYEIRKAREFDRQVQVAAFDKSLRMRLSEIDMSRTGEFVNDITNEVSRANSAIFIVISTIGHVLQLLLYVGVMVTISVWLSLALLVMALVQVRLMRGMMSKSQDISEQITACNQSLSTFLVERLRSLRLVRLSGTEATELNSLDQLVRNLNQRAISIQMISARIPIIVEPMAVLMIFMLMYVGTDLLGMQIEFLVMFAASTLRLLPILQQIMISYQNVLSVSASLRTTINRIEVLSESGEPTGGPRKFEGLKDAIKFENVSFRYGFENGPLALDNISLEIPAGKITGLVGPSGSGKSTLIDLLPMLRDPIGGEIQFDGIPRDEFSVQSLRTKIAFVPQSPQVFNESVEQHIRYGNPDISKEEIIKAAKLADAEEFIGELPLGYDTLIGENGIRLSGGQRQRLDLARAVARNSSILILAEPASGLDADAEEHFRRALVRIKENTGVTIVLIAHGFSTVVAADQIVVLRKGHVEESGTHEFLMKSSSWYAQAFNKQHHAVLSGPLSDAEK